MTYAEIVQALRNEGHKPRTIFAPKLERTFMRSGDALMGTPRKWGLSAAASLIKVFLPYLTNNTVFGNDNIVEVLGKKPVRFSEYAYPLLSPSARVVAAISRQRS